MLKSSPFVDQQTLSNQPNGGSTWEWLPSLYFARKFNTLDRYSNLDWNYPPFTLNGIRPNEDGWEVTLVFRIELQHIIAQFGEPSLAVPYTYTRTGGMYFKLYFDQMNGYFVASIRCDSAALEANTTVVAHRSTTNSSPTADPQAIIWQGYTSDLPNCSIFQP